MKKQWDDIMLFSEDGERAQIDNIDNCYTEYDVYKIVLDWHAEVYGIFDDSIRRNSKGNAK